MLGVTRIFDGNKLYSISPDDEEVTISSQDPEDETTITPNKMLYFYEEGYYFEMDESRFIGNGQFRKKIQYVKLIPKDSEAEIKYILLGIDTEFNQIIFSLNFFATFIKSGTLAIEPSSFIISTITPAGFSPASLGRSIAASV